eukprot:scaffold248543_cov93-Cyclotella_meneghiniana.AAC.2
MHVTCPFSTSVYISIRSRQREPCGLSASDVTGALQVMLGWDFVMHSCRSLPMDSLPSPRTWTTSRKPLLNCIGMFFHP